jgi:purine-nucleoside/S-methyl-5'-thioadenosine phosphorylase / adenosine deaminase
MEWREADGVRWLEARMSGATVAFSTRLGGTSAPPFDTLNLGLFTEDDRAAVVENRERLAAALGFAPERAVIARQVHGAELVAHEGPQSPSPYARPDSPIAEADGHFTSAPGLPLLVFVADCVPVALSGPGGVAMLHCGWRGLAAGILARGVEAVGATEAAIGPAIGPCCYEVGNDVLSALDSESTFRPDGRVDLGAVARRLLGEAGVERVESSGLCTSCEDELFFSHRRDAGRTGRQAGIVWRDAEGG